MIDLIIKTGYEDDGVDGFTCLHCKDHISIRVSWSHGILYCPYCGTKFNGAWIYTKTSREIKHKVNNHPSRVKTYWQLESKELDYHSDGEPFGDTSWQEVQRTHIHCDKKRLLQIQKEIIQKFLTVDKRNLPWFSKRDFMTRLVYIREYPNLKDDRVTGSYIPYGKKIIVSVIKETLHTIHPKKKKKIT